MPNNPVNPPLPADLPVNWNIGDTVSPTGVDVGLTQKHGYNYLMQQVNAAQQAANDLGTGFAGLTPASLGAVPTSRTINGKALSSNISLTPTDIGVTAKRTCRFVVGTSTNGWTQDDCDYLCDGVDDQVEIQAAIDALSWKGGEIHLLDGTYNLTDYINFKSSGGILSGNGFGTVLKRMFSGGNYGLLCLAGNGENNTIRNLKIDCNGDNYTASINGEVYGYGHNSLLDHIEVYNCKNYKTINLSGKSMVKNCYIHDNSNNDAIVCTHTTIMGNVFARNKTDINIIDNCCVIGNEMIETVDSAISGNVGIKISGNKNTVSGNVITNHRWCCFLSYASYSTISGNIFQNDEGAVSGSTPWDTIYVGGENNNYNLICDNNIYGRNYQSMGGTGNTFVNNKYN